MGRVTIRNIAEQAGVSVTAVSFAFNEPARLSEGTLQRILEVAEELGYAPDPIARSMTTGRTGTIGILLPQPIPEAMRNPFLPELVEGIGEVCTATGHSLMLVPPLEGSVRRAVENAVVDGFLTLGLELFKSTMMVLRRRGVPFVMVDSDPIEEVPSVNVEDEKGAFEAMNYILDHGHRRIAIIAIRSGREGRHQEYAGTLRKRMNGYGRALAQVGLTVEYDGISLLESSSTASGGREAFKELTRTKVRPTAVVAMSDAIAVGVIHEARAAGLRIPEDISVVGFDDVPISRLISPPLTTVAQPLRQKGKLAAEILIDHIQGQKETNHHVLPTTLIVRESVQTVSDFQSD